MQKKAISIGSIVLVLAAFSAFARWIQNQAAFELETGLMIHGSIWSKLTFLLAVLCLLGIAWVVRSLWYEGYYAPTTLDKIIVGNPLWMNRFAKVIAVLMTVGAGVAFLVAGYELYSTMVRTLCVLAIAAAWGVVKLSSLPAWEKKMPFMETVLAALPAVMYVYWLLVSYRTHGAVPSVWSYAAEVFAICMSVLGTFYFAGYAFDFPKPYVTLTCLLCGAYLSLMTLPDSRNVGLALMLLAGAAMQLYLAWMIVTSMTAEWPEETDGFSEE
ncbi:MAG: hypothetical protein IJA67_04995 [Oscillospiraceae bacterium]|nr:hypothetical protein [Oscillospiraceae bacterium]